MRPRTRRKDGDRRRDPVVAQVIEIDLARARGFGGLGEIVLRRIALHGGAEVASETLGDGPVGDVALREKRRDHMQTLPAGRLAESLELC